MSRREIYATGVRLIGVYFLCIAFVGVVVLAVRLLDIGFQGPQISGLDMHWRFLVISLPAPLANVLVSVVLIHKTDWCLNRIGIKAEPIETDAA
jgi:hypothetical protein